LFLHWVKNGYRATVGVTLLFGAHVAALSRRRERNLFLVRQFQEGPSQTVSLDAGVAMAWSGGENGQA